MEEEDREAFTASKLLGVSVALYGGKYAIAFPSFGPERRGAPVLAFTRIDGKKIYDRSEIRKCDLLWFWMKPFLVKAFLMI